MTTHQMATRQATDQEVIIAARGVSKYYGTPPQRVLVLDDINLDLRADEFVALLGPSGSGKSTLLRILAGLSTPSSGEVLVHGGSLVGVNPHVAIVFQSFALYPWLTVQDNVELGLLARDMSAAERRERALRAIDLIGLDGFEMAYPRELSGGMKQRVGLARALVVEPEVLFLDEPFSALDVLVAENLRHELLGLWRARKMLTRAILMVTHNIDEAVEMADRLIILSTNPGRIRGDLPGLPRESRQPRASAHAELVDMVYRIMTNPQAEISALPRGAPPTAQLAPPAQPYQALPQVSIGELTGFIERLHALGDREDLYELARDLRMDADDLLALAQAANLLGFADLEAGDVLLTAAGRRLAEAGILEEKVIFRQQVMLTIALIRQITRELQAAPDHRMRDDGLLKELQRSFSVPEARRQLDTAIDWGRYAEVFAYDDDAGEFFLEDDAPIAKG